MFESLFSKGGLSLDRLRSFLEMAEAGGIAKAAPGEVVQEGPERKANFSISWVPSGERTTFPA